MVTIASWVGGASQVLIIQYLHFQQHDPVAMRPFPWVQQPPSFLKKGHLGRMKPYKNPLRMANVGPVGCKCCQYFHLSRFQILRAASHLVTNGWKTAWSIVLTLPISNKRLSSYIVDSSLHFQGFLLRKPSTADQLSISDWCPSSNIKLCWHSLDVWRNHPIGVLKKSSPEIRYALFQRSCHQSCCASPHLPIPSHNSDPHPFKGTIFLFQAVTQQTKEGHITSVGPLTGLGPLTDSIESSMVVEEAGVLVISY